MGQIHLQQPVRELGTMDGGQVFGLDGTEQNLLCSQGYASPPSSPDFPHLSSNHISLLYWVALLIYEMLDNLDKTKITGDSNVDAVQDGVNEGVTGQLGKGGMLEGVGNMTSKEVLTRSERQGKNEEGKPGL